MAIKSRSFECPDCMGIFTVYLDASDPPPAYCTLCGGNMGAEPIALPSAFKIGTQQGKTYDRVYRQMEASSAARAQEAADRLGVPLAEVSDIKVTNMKDNIREGESSAILPTVKPVDTTPMAPPLSSASGPHMLSGAQGMATAQMAAQGGRHGTVARESLTKGHKQRAARMSLAGNMGAWSPE